MTKYTVEISDGKSSNGGGTTTVDAANMVAAKEVAREWTRGGDWEHAAPEARVRVTITPVNSPDEPESIEVRVGDLAY